MNQRVLCLWLPNWSIQRVHAAESALANHAIVLETRDPRRGLLVAAANRAARRAGAMVGMRLSELSALCSGPATTLWEIRPYQPDEDLDALCELAEQAQQFSPVVGLEIHDDRPWVGRTSCQAQGLYLDISGIPHLFGGEAPLLDEVSAWLSQQRLFAYLSIASTVGAAWALANYEIPRRARRSKATDPLRTDTSVHPDASHTGSDSSNHTRHQTSKHTPAEALAPSVARPTAPLPDSQSLMTESWEEAELLSNLPVSALRVDSETVNKLHRLGVRTVCDVWQLPRDGLASRLGPQLLKRSDQALGTHAEPITALHSAPDWSLEQALEHPTRAHVTLAEVLRLLCHELSLRLRARGFGALRCVCRLDLVRSRPLLMQLGLFRASDDADHLHSLLVAQIEQTMSGWEEDRGLSREATSRLSAKKSPKNLDRQGPLAIDDAGSVWRVCLQVTMTAPIVWQQTQLFDEPDVQQRQELAQLIDNLSSRLGRRQVLEARIERDAEPQQAVSYRPLTGRRGDGSEQQTLRKLNSRLASSGAEPRPTDPLRRPTKLLNPPELLIGVTQRPEAPPSEFVYEGRRHRVGQYWGPERLESGWWRGPSTRREYFRLETHTGAWWWIFQDVASGQWYVHGLFG